MPVVETATASFSGKVMFMSIISAVAWILTYANINKEVFSIFITLTVIDSLTGALKAWVLADPVTSVKLRYGVASKFSLVLLPIVIGLGARALGHDADALFTWGMNLLILSEVYSIVGNTYTIRTKKYLPEWDVIALFGTKIRESMILRDNRDE